MSQMETIKDGAEREQLLQYLTDPRIFDHGTFSLITLAHMPLEELKAVVQETNKQGNE